MCTPPGCPRNRPGLHTNGGAAAHQAAREYARQGRRTECVELPAGAQELHEKLPARPSRRFSVDNSMVASHAIASRTASSCLWLEDYQQAAAHAREALAGQESAVAADRSPTQEAAVHIDLGSAPVHLGSLDEAVAHGSQELSSARVTNSVLSRTGELDRTLMVRFPRKRSSRVSLSNTGRWPDRPAKNAPDALVCGQGTVNQRPSQVRLQIVRSRHPQTRSPTG